jgi:hypothetical protein
MGGVVQSIFGGSNTKQQQTQQASSGFGALPPAIQDVISQMATSAGGILDPNGTPNSSLFKLPALSSPASSALSQIENQDFAITPQSIQTDINEQMNPYNSSVIGQIENAQNGNLSQLNSYLTNSGTFGSNRGMLGASDISNVAANQIGTFLNGQFNTSLQNALTTIPQNQAQSAAGALQGGLLQQQQTLQNQLAPITALQQLAKILQTGVPNTSQSTGQSTGSSSSVNNPLATLFGGGSNAFGGISSALGALGSSGGSSAVNQAILAAAEMA